MSILPLTCPNSVLNLSRQVICTSNIHRVSGHYPQPEDTRTTLYKTVLLMCHPQQRSIKHTPWLTTVPHSHKTLQTQSIRGAQTHHHSVCAKFVCMSPDQLRIYITGYVSAPVIACLQPSLTFRASHEILQRWTVVHAKLANHAVINFTLSPVHQNLDRRISHFALSSEIVQVL